MRENRIGGIPIVTDDFKLEGIITNRDLRFEKDTAKKVSEVMTKANLVITDESTDLIMAKDIHCPTLKLKYKTSSLQKSKINLPKPNKKTRLKNIKPSFNFFVDK